MRNVPSRLPRKRRKFPLVELFFIDSTWNQSRGIYKDQRLREIPCVVIQSRISQFWRHQHGSPRWFLATIEAVHQFLIELHIICKLGGEGLLENSEQCKNQNISKLEESSSSLNSAVTPSRSQTSQVNVQTPHTVPCSVNPVKNPSQNPEKQPSKFVKNLSLCRGIRLDPGGDHGIDLCGPDQWKGKYAGEYDNLLFFFQFMYHKIHSIYDHNKLRSYQRVMI